MDTAELDKLMVRYLAGHPQRDELLRSVAAVGSEERARGDRAALLDALLSECKGAIARDHARVYHPNNVRSSFRFYKRAARYGALDEKQVLDFGCGPHEGLGVSLLMWANGARDVVAIDTEPLADAARTSKFLGAFALGCLESPTEWLWSDGDRSRFVNRMVMADLEKLAVGDLDAGLGSVPIRHMVGGVEDSDIDAESLDLVVSQSVMEHVSDLRGTLSYLRSRMAPEGLLCAAIDFRDHRLYAHGLSPWLYLMDDGDYSPGYVNKIRFTEMMKIFEESGFTILDNELVREEPPQDVLDNLHERFRKLSGEDLRVAASYAIFRRK